MADPHRPKKKYLCYETKFDGVVYCQLVFDDDRRIVGREDVVPMPTQLFSTYCLPGSEIAMGFILPDRMILAIGYSLKDKQFSVTGSCTFGETHEDAAVREILEEIGLSVTTDELHLLHTSKKTRYRQACTATHFALDVDALGDDMAISTTLHEPEGKPDPSNKVSVIVHGSYKAMTALLAKIGPTDTTETISFFAIVPYDAIELIVAKITDGSNG